MAPVEPVIAADDGMGESTEHPKTLAVQDIKEQAGMNDDPDDPGMSMVDDAECLMLIGAIGIDVKSYKRESTTRRSDELSRRYTRRRE